MKRFFWIPFLLLLALFSATLLNAAVADGLVQGWCAQLDDLQDTAQAEDLSLIHILFSMIDPFALLGVRTNAPLFFVLRR